MKMMIRKLQAASAMQLGHHRLTTALAPLSRQGVQTATMTRMARGASVKNGRRATTRDGRTAPTPKPTPQQSRRPVPLHSLRPWALLLLRASQQPCGRQAVACANTGCTDDPDDVEAGNTAGSTATTMVVAVFGVMFAIISVS